MIERKPSIIRRKNFKYIIILSLFLVISIGIFIYFTNSKNQSPTQDKNSVNYSPATTEQQNNGTSIKKDSIEKQNNKNSNSSDSPVAPTVQSDGRGLVTVDISSLNQTDETYQIRIDIGAVTNIGSCELTLKKADVTITKTAAIYPLAKNTTCQGFDIPLSELSAGSWQLKVSFNSTSLTGNISKEITIK